MKPADRPATALCAPLNSQTTGGEVGLPGAPTCFELLREFDDYVRLGPPTPAILGDRVVPLHDVRPELRASEVLWLPLLFSRVGGRFPVLGPMVGADVATLVRFAGEA